MAITLYRIAKETPTYPALDLTGGGAKATGGRWNSKGQPVVYLASSIALATLETLAHIGDTVVSRNRFLVAVTVPPAVWKRRATWAASSLNPAWAAEPPGITSTSLGDAWLTACNEAILEVPSVLIPEEYNVLVNPTHPDAKKLTATVVRLFDYDPRLL